MSGPAAPLPPPGRDPRNTQPQPPAGQSATPQPDPPVQIVKVPPAIPQPERRPRRSRADLTPKQREVTAADEAAFATMEAELGGRPSLAAILAGADLNQDEARVAGLLADPTNDKVSLAKICIGANVSMSRLMKLFQAAALVKGQTKAIQRIAAKLPDVAAGVMEDAVAGEKPCPICHGFQFIAKPTKDDPNATIECGECRGKGTIWYQPEANIREIALRIGGLLEKGGGAKILIANQNNNSGPGVADPQSFDQLMASIDGVLYGQGRSRQSTPASGGEDPIDGEVTEPA